MSQASPTEPVVVGVEPWLPWPFSAWSWWTRPVPAERLAILRIGLAFCLLVDLILTYRPHLDDFFAKGGLGSPELFAWYAQASRWNWSLLRGFGDPLLSTIALVGFVCATIWIAFGFIGRLTAKSMPVRRDSFAISIWNLAGSVFVLGIWSRAIADKGESVLPWAIPMALIGIGYLFLVLEFYVQVVRQAGERNRARLAWLVGGGVLTTALCVAGFFLPFADWAEETDFSLGHRLLLSWQDDPQLLYAAFWIWVGATLGLLLGLGTRMMAVAVWLLSVSFAHANAYIDNAGDVVRSIILFYLMLCPCGAAWSLDRAVSRLWSKDERPRYVHPWPLRLLFVQMAVIYFFNGVYKLFGSTWQEGSSLFYVFGDVVLARVAHEQLPIPYWMTRIMTWTVLAWEVGFPLWVSLRWTRTAALIMGVLFHLGIFFTMELGSFSPYMLTLYLPLLPLRRWREAAIS